jgi:DNA (cytosine-5)-methyltransferase 1
MSKFDDFHRWLGANSTYTKETKSNIVSRVRRADKLMPVTEDPVYLFSLSQCSEFAKLSVSVKSQMRRAVRIYLKYLEIEGQNANE